MPTTYDTVLERLASAFSTLEEGADPVLRHSERGDYQANGAMALAKRLGRPPREVAESVVAAADLGGVAALEVAGPGFLNVILEPAFLSSQLATLLGDARLGVELVTARRIVLDYSSPNVVKAMHVGHLRSMAIGDALARTLRFVGHEVIARNHVGDWGTSFGMLIEYLLELGGGVSGDIAIGDLDASYRAARAKFTDDEAFRDRSRARVAELQRGDETTRAMWQQLAATSLRHFDEVYAALDILLGPDDVVGESAYHDSLAGIVEGLRERGLLEESGGALCVFPPGFTNREGEPLPLIIQKRDEGFGYAATDLAALRDRVETLRADELLYVVGAPQAQHFEMIFAVARLAGWLPDRVRAEHVTFGNILGADHKMFKSRAGDTVEFTALLDEAIERARESLRVRRSDLDETARDALALDVARAAIKYADLSSDRQHDYVFDLERMVSFEGDTGPYLQYAHARIRSIFRRADEDAPPTASFALASAPERDLALGILGFPEALGGAAAALQPHRLCGYLFDLAQRFTAFYDTCPVLASEGDQRVERLALCDLSARTLALGLSLLGIAAPERM